MGKFRNTAVAVAIAAMGWLAAAGSTSAHAAMPAGPISTQPIGHYEFCLREPHECRPNPGRLSPVHLSRALWDKVVEINNLVNTMITPRTDWELWGVEEYWSYPVAGYGDCEDYALEKRRLLMEIGVPASSLLITVVRQQNGDGHAVLTLRTDMGDFVLDNLEPRVLSWTETTYRYLKRQTPRHSGMWEKIQDGRDVLVGSVGGS